MLQINSMLMYFIAFIAKRTTVLCWIKKKRNIVLMQSLRTTLTTLFSIFNLYCDLMLSPVVIHHYHMINIVLTVFKAKFIESFLFFFDKKSVTSIIPIYREKKTPPVLPRVEIKSSLNRTDIWLNSREKRTIEFFLQNFLVFFYQREK